MAVLIWGRLRFTADIDIVIEIKPLRDLNESGYIDEDTADEMVRSGGEFNFIDGPTGIKVDFWVSDNGGFDLSRLERRVAKEILG